MRQATPCRPGPGVRTPFRPGLSAVTLVAAFFLAATPAEAASLWVCRTFDVASPLTPPLTVPANSLFRDNGRADDPLAAFTLDRWQLRLETIQPVILQPLQQCAAALVRVTSDSSVKSVAAADNRTFVYVGSSDLLQTSPMSEDLLSLTGAVLDRVP